MSVPLASSPSSSPSIVEIRTSRPDVSSLSGGPPPEVPSVSASSAPFDTSLAVFPRAASSLGSVTPPLSGAAPKGLTNTDTVSPSCGLLQYLSDRLAQRDVEFAKLDDEYIQHDELATSLEACMADKESQLIASCFNCNVGQAANDDMLKSRGNGREELSTLDARSLGRRAELQAPHSSHSNLADAIRGQDCTKALLQSPPSQVQGLHAGYVDIERRAQDSQASLCDGIF